MRLPNALVILLLAIASWLIVIIAIAVVTWVICGLLDLKL